MKSLNVPLPTGSYKYESNKVSTQRLVNLFSQKVEHNNSMVNTGTSFAILSIPGSTSAVSLPTSGSNIGIRGIYGSSTGPSPDFTEKLYVADGATIFRVNPDNTSVKLGDVGPNAGRIYITESGGLDSQLCVVDGYNLWTASLIASDMDVVNTLTPVTLPFIAGTDYTPITPTQIVNLNGHVILNSDNSNQFYYSKVNDVTSTSAWSNAAFYTKYGSSDVINGLATVGGTLVVFGTKSFELWNETGNYLNPFARIGGSFQWIGCQAPDSISTLQDKLFWLGSGPAGHNMIFMMDPSGNCTRISNNSLEYQFNRFKDTTDAIGFCYSDDGNYFYVISFVTDDRTFVFDMSTQEWHERTSHDLYTNEDHRWNPTFASFCYGKLYFGSADNSVLLFLDDSSQTEWDGRPIVKYLVTPMYYSNYNNFIVREFMLYCNVGETTLLEGQGSDPQIMLAISDDGGYTWSSEYWEPLGKQGNYLNIVRWFDIGETRNCVIKLQVSDPVNLVLISAKMNVSECRND